MTRKIIIIIFFIFLMQFSYGQIIDRYGLNVGASYSTQLWDFKHIPVDWDRDYKVGLMTFISAEKFFGKFGLRTEIGYLQKGFKDTRELIFSDGTSISSKNKSVILNDLALNIGLKFTPFKFENSPYIFIGGRGDYLISYKDIVLEEPISGYKFNLYKSDIEEFSKFNLGGLVGIGIDIKEMFYFEIEYNPNFTKNLDDKGLSIKDKCFGVKIGVNINKLKK